MATIKKVYLVHGYQAAPEKHWFKWLAKQVQDAGHQAKIVAFTQPEQPDFAIWQQDLQRDLTELDENTIIVAHSLGCLSSLHFLSTHLMENKIIENKIQALFLVAGFMDLLPALPELNGFIQQAALNEWTLQSKIQTRVVLVSNNDRLVPAPFVIRLGHFLKAQLDEVVDAGHFMQEDGFNEFPLLWEKLEPLLQR